MINIILMVSLALQPMSVMDRHEFRTRVYERTLIEQGENKFQREVMLGEYAQLTNQLISLCSHCKKVIRTRHLVKARGLSHGICDDCAVKHYDIYMSDLPDMGKIQELRERYMNRYFKFKA